MFGVVGGILENCSFPGCKNRKHSKGLCSAHYAQQRVGKTLKPLQLQNHGLSEVDRFMRWIGKQPNGCWTWLGSIKHRRNRPQSEWHGQWRNAAGQIELTSRAAWRLLVGPIPSRAFVLHKCDVPRCCNPEHLYLGTQADNVRDMWERERAKPRALEGVKHGGAKANDEIVRDIRASKESTAILAAKHGLSRATVHDIRLRNTWKHVK